MAKSLNEAFIKAYSKERAASQQRRASAPEDDNPYIVRIDTATVVIPEPHFLNARPTSTAAIVGEDLPTRAAAVAKDSRAAIAAEMLKAGGWLNSQTDAFVGGFPMLSNIPTPSSMPKRDQTTVAPKPVEAKETVPNNNVETFNGAVPAERGDERLHSSLQEPNVRVPSTPETPSAPREEPSVVASQNAPAIISEAELQAEQQAARAAADLEPAREMAELAAPIAPALSFAEVERAVDSVSEKHRTSGTIFRLDRPSYSNGANEVGLESLEEKVNEEWSESSGEQSSMLDMPTSTSAMNDLEETDYVSKNFSARAVEEGLRQARVRVFNPVWEVDRLQWPPVCVELLKQREKNMQRVAANLITACQEGLQVLAVTSPQGGEGRTTVACCLAMLAGRHGLNVAIVDGDIENPTLGYQTNLDVEQDWKQAISQELSLEEVAIHSIDDQVTLLPLMAPIDPREMSADDNRIAYMLHELAESFDLVIVDTGHMNSTASLVTSMGEQGLISAVVTVVDQRASTRHRVDACVQRIRKIGISSIGLVENFTAAEGR